MQFTRLRRRYGFEDRKKNLMIDVRIIADFSCQFMYC